MEGREEKEGMGGTEGRRGGKKGGSKGGSGRRKVVEGKEEIGKWGNNC